MNERRWLTLIFVLYFLLAFGYSLLMPVWEAPDEPAHYHVAWYLARAHRYPTEKMNYEAKQPRTFYYLGAWVLRGLDELNTRYTEYYFPHEYRANIRVPIRRFDWNDKNYRFMLGVHVLRWINIIFGGLALWLNWKAFQLIAIHKVELQLTALTLTALTPQYIHITSSVSNDTLGTLAGASLFYLSMQTLQDKTNRFMLLYIPLAVILPFVTKLTVLPVSLALIIVVLWKSFFKSVQLKWLVISVVFVLVLAGVFYVLLPEMIRAAIGEINWRLFSLRKNALTYNYLVFISRQIIQTYWGEVGWLAVGLPSWISVFLPISGFMGAMLSLRSLSRSRNTDPTARYWVAVWLIALLTILVVARNGLTTGATQGRFLFPAIGALSLLMAHGWYDILPERYQHKLPVFMLLFMLTCNLLLWFTGIIPIYYQPFLD